MDEKKFFKIFKFLQKKICSNPEGNTGTTGETSPKGIIEAKGDIISKGETVQKNLILAKFKTTH